MTINVGIIAFDQVEELDLVGPWEVFQTANMLDDSFKCEIISFDGEGVNASKGMYFGVHEVMDSNKHYDVLVMPGGIGAWALMEDEPFIKRLLSLANNATWVTSVCSGALVYAQAGLLANKQCTTWYGCIDELEDMKKTGEVIRNTRFIQDGHTVTSAGVSAGIDMSLWLVGQLKSPEFAREVQQFIEYFPEPPYGELELKTA